MGKALRGCRSTPLAEESSLQVIAYHDVRDDVTGDYDPDQYAVSTRNLILQFTWLREHGYQPVSLDDVIAAENNGPPLPERAVLLTFDDGWGLVRASNTQPALVLRFEALSEHYFGDAVRFGC